MSSVFESAVRLLTRREHGAFELTNKLVQRGFTKTAIHDALMECQRLELQSDARFVEMMIRTRIRQGYGPLRIRKELQHLQIDSELIEEALRQEHDNWLSYAIGVWKKKYKEEEAFSYQALQKQKQFLLYRGFSTDTIRDVQMNITSMKMVFNTND